MGNYLKDMFVEVREQKEVSSLDDVIDKDFIEETKKIDIKTLINMIEEAVEESTETIAEEVPNIGAASDDEAIEMILKMIPNIEVSEIGWSDVRTPDEADEKEIKGPQRQLLEGYLSNIQGSDFADKIRSVSQFYTNGISMVEAQAGDERTKRISQAISYLVFYKTLTKP